MNKRKRFHPGFYLKENVECTGSTVESLARSLELSTPECQALLDGKRDIDEPLAQKIAAIYGTSAAFWLNLQSAYDSEKISQ